MADPEPKEPDLVECECGIVFTPLRCPGPDCQNEKHGLAVVSLAEKRVLELARAWFVSWNGQSPSEALVEERALYEAVQEVS